MKSENNDMNKTDETESGFLFDLEKIIKDRKQNPVKDSYTNSLFNAGLKRIAQKVGEEATEVIIEAVDGDTEKFKNEAADLIYHLLVLIAEKDLSIDDIIAVLKKRHR